MGTRAFSRSFSEVSRSLAGLLLAAGAAHGADIVATPADYLPQARRLQAGDTLWLAPGDYTQGLPIVGLRGSAALPIRIRARTADRRPRFLAQSGRNTISIVDAEYVEVSDLDLDGAGLPVDAVKAEGHARFAHHITLEGLRIVGHGFHQQNVGISTKCPATGWVVRGNEIVGAGTGMYFGNSDGSAPFVAGLIERNVVRDTLGYNLQIKHQKVRPAGVGLPTGASVTVIRHNLLSKANNGALREFARPNLLVGHWPPSGDGADDTYLIHGNVFFANPTEALFQGEGNIALYGNLFLNPEGAAVRIQPHNGRPDRIDIFFNTMFARTDGIRVVGGNPAHRQQVWGNAIFAGAAAAGWDPRDNLAGALDEASAYVERFDPALTLLDPRPTASMLRAEIRDAAAQRLYPDSAEDLCGHPRGVVAVGAFAAAPTPPHFPLRKRPLREPFCP